MNGVSPLAYVNSNSLVHGEDKTREFTEAELQQHGDRKIIVVHGSVFDMTDYLHHPGGLLFRNRMFATDLGPVGFDRTVMFEETSHSDSVRNTVMDFYRIGYMQGHRFQAVPRAGEYCSPGELAFQVVDLRRNEDHDNAVMATAVAAATAAAWWWCMGKLI